jgi:hypothetical protein
VTSEAGAVTGTYVTIWLQQAGGGWRVLDTGAQD